MSQSAGLIWFQDLDGDGRSDQRTLVAGVGSDPTRDSKDAPFRDRWNAQPIFSNLDNWIYSPRHGVRIRTMPGPPGNWTCEPISTERHTISGHDEGGRLIHVSTAGRFHLESLPYRFLHQNPNHVPETPVAEVSTETQVASIRRGIRGDILIQSPLLEEASRSKAAPDTPSAPPTGAVIYRGDLLPAQYRNALFACDPEHGTIRQYRIIFDTDSTKAHA